MGQYENLIKALRSASTVSIAWGKLMRDAAAAIEALQAEVKSYKTLVENKERLLGLYRAEQRNVYSAMDDNGRIIENPCACMNIPVFPDSSESPNS